MKKPSIDDFKISESDEVRMLGIPHGYKCVYILNQFLLLIFLEEHVPLGESRLASSVLNQDETDHVSILELGSNRV